MKAKEEPMSDPNQLMLYMSWILFLLAVLCTIASVFNEKDSVTDTLLWIWICILCMRWIVYDQSLVAHVGGVPK